MKHSKGARVYSSKSMSGTFLFGDNLVLEPLSLTQLRCGDIVVYHRENDDGDEEEIVHRIRSIEPQGLVVQGDNNPFPDQTLVSETNYVGRVSYIERAGCLIKVRGGVWGGCRASLKRAYRAVLHIMGRFIRKLGRRAYGWLRSSGWVAKAWHPTIKKVQVMTDAGPMIKYVCRNRTVASYWPENKIFRCRKPFDLILTKETIKTPSS